MAFDLVNLKAGLATVFADLTGKTAVVKAGEVGDEFDAHWKGSTGSTPHTTQCLPFLRRSSWNNGPPGAAGRIRTAGVVVTAELTLTHIRSVWVNDGGDGTDRYDVGLYDESGALVASVGAVTHSGTAAYTVVDDAVAGAPVTLAPGGYIAAYTTKNNNIAPLWVAQDDMPLFATEDRHWGYPAETSATGALPATITVPVGTIDAVQNMMWFSLIGT